MVGFYLVVGSCLFSDLASLSVMLPFGILLCSQICTIRLIAGAKVVINLEIPKFLIFFIK